MFSDLVERFELVQTCGEHMTDGLAWTIAKVGRRFRVRVWRVGQGDLVVRRDVDSMAEAIEATYWREGQVRLEVVV